MKLHVVQANEGDCMVLECSGAQPRYALIDGGPKKVYEDHCCGVLQSIAAGGGALDLMVATHVDTDHVIGLLDLLAELRQQRAAEERETIAVKAIWHNTFSQTVGSGGEIESRLAELLSLSSAVGAMTTTRAVLEGIQEGHILGVQAALLDVPVNEGFPDRVIRVDTAPGPISLGDAALRIVGPTATDIEALRRKWEQWLDENEDAIASGDFEVAARADKKVENLSSIMFVAEENGRRLLLSGDGLGAHLLNGLGEAGMLAAGGTFHVEVLKVPHHGSNANVTKGFFEKLTADRYVFSANGANDNPDFETLKWLVTTVKDQGREVEIIVTNETESTQQLAADYDDTEYGYTLTIMPAGSHSMTIDI